jgi:outer membrane biosynthesis protein TonB
MQFADTQEARDVFDLYEGGFLNAFSVGFKPIEIAYEERVPGSSEMGAVFKKAELLENSAVPVPANPGALVMKALMGAACRAFGVKAPDDAPSAAPEPSQEPVLPPKEDTPEPSAEAAGEAPPAATAAEPAPQEAPSQPEADKIEPTAAPPNLKDTLAYLLGLGKIIKSQGKVGDEELRSLLIQANNLCRELVYGPAAAPIQEPGDDLSDEEIAALVREYEHLSEAVAKNPSASDADRKELNKIGDLIAGTISGE